MAFVEVILIRHPAQLDMEDWKMRGKIRRSVLTLAALSTLALTVFGNAQGGQRVPHKAIEWRLLTACKSGPFRVAVHNTYCSLVNS